MLLLEGLVPAWKTVLEVLTQGWLPPFVRQHWEGTCACTAGLELLAGSPGFPWLCPIPWLCPLWSPHLHPLWPPELPHCRAGRGGTPMREQVLPAPSSCWRDEPPSSQETLTARL